MALRGQSKLSRHAVRLIAPGILLLIGSLVFACLVTVTIPRSTGIDDDALRFPDPVDNAKGPLNTASLIIVRPQILDSEVGQYHVDPSKFSEQPDVFTSSQIVDTFETTIIRLASQDSGQIKEVPSSHFNLDQPPLHDPKFKPMQAILFARKISKPYFSRHHHLEPNPTTPEHIKSLLKGWCAFTETHKMHWWIAHDQLVGWFWNARLPPWSTYLSVQMSVRQLLKLQQHNGTLIAGRFRVYVNPAFMIRAHDTANPVDARFFDILTGYMIEVEGMSIVHGGGARVHSKDGTSHALDDLMPLHETYLDGLMVWRPRAAMKILAEAYGEEILYETKQRVGVLDYEWSSGKNAWITND
ncbi:hypothetical protein HDU81_002097 [Chytriomyces hyalinus]|nr:hypothetical protein HDU81_002097 [Chytriomyces hyalinus]